MRNLIAILVLATIASPLKAQNLSADVTLKALLKSQAGQQGLVQEYDGRKNDLLHSGSADFKAAATGAKTYLNLSGSEMGSGEGSWGIDLNVGALSLNAYEANMVHRQPWVRTGMIINSTWSVNGGQRPQNPLTAFGGAIGFASTDVSGLSFKRTESNLKVAYAPGDYGVHAGLWEENEQGNMIARYSTIVMADETDRHIKMINLGFDAGIGDGAVAYDYTRANFSDNAATVYISTWSYPELKHRAPPHRMDLRSLSFRSHPIAGYNLTGSLMSRTREGLVNGYKMGSYTAALAASHRFGKDLNVTIKGYGRTEQMSENDAWFIVKTYSKTGSGVPTAFSFGETSYVDKANFKGEMLIDYDFSEKLGFSLGYKLDHNYRRHAKAEVYSSSQTYTDGVFIDKNTQYNAWAKKNTQNIYSADVNASLPMDAELGLGFKAVRANVAVFESLPNKSDEYSADLYVPIKGNLFFTGSAMVMSGENDESNHTNSKDNQNSYLAGLEWSGGKYTAGANYAFDQTSSHSDIYFGGYSDIAPANDIPSKRSIRELGVLYRAANDTLGFHATAKLSNEYMLAANSSYTRSLGKAPVNVVLTKAGDAGTVNDLEPSDIRIVSTGLNLKFTPATNKSLSASLGLRRDQWTDKMNSQNSGWVNSASVALSSRF